MCPKNWGQYIFLPIPMLYGVFMEYSWSIHGVFMGYSYVSVMYRLCIGYASVMYRNMMRARKKNLQV